MKLNTDINLKFLVEAINTHSGLNAICCSETLISLNGKTIEIAGGLVKNGHVCFRYTCPKNLLIGLKNEGLLPISHGTMNHILNRFRKVEGLERAYN